MDKKYLTDIKNIWTSLSFFKKLGAIISLPFMFIAAIVYELFGTIKEDIVNASCQPTFFNAFASVLGLFVKYVIIVVMTAIIVFFMLFIILLLLAVMIEFPWISLSVAIFFALISLGVKTIRNHNPERVAQAKKEHDEQIDAIVKRYRNKYIQLSKI